MLPNVLGFLTALFCQGRSSGARYTTSRTPLGYFKWLGNTDCLVHFPGFRPPPPSVVVRRTRLSALSLALAVPLPLQPRKGHLPPTYCSAAGMRSVAQWEQRHPRVPAPNEHSMPTCRCTGTERVPITPWGAREGVRLLGLNTRLPRDLPPPPWPHSALPKVAGVGPHMTIGAGRRSGSGMAAWLSPPPLWGPAYGRSHAAMPPPPLIFVNGEKSFDAANRQESSNI